MAAQNTKTNHIANKIVISPEAKLTKLTLAHMLFENQFYIDGQDSADALVAAVNNVSPEFAQNLAVKARTSYKLRHVPLMLTAALLKAGKAPSNFITNVIQRPDEMGELISLYWKNGKSPLSNQLKKGLANCFLKFNEYQLAKHDKNSASISIRDIMFMTHPKPQTDIQVELFKRIASKAMVTPDTWETNLSAGANKKETFERLIAENKLGALAFLRNLRNMTEAGVSETLIKDYAKVVNVDNVLPFRYIAAVNTNPKFMPMIESMMLKSLNALPKLSGKTILVVDTSGSMHADLSGKSGLNRLDAACAIAIMAREICEDVVIYATAGDDYSKKHATMLIPAYKGFALSDFIKSEKVQRQIGGGGIFLTQCMEYIQQQEGAADRVIVFTDEQDTGGRGFEPERAVTLAKDKNYIVNVGSYENGISHGKYTSITGFSEAVINYIYESEKVN